MTGPPLPRPVAGDNAVGKFKIGVSPIGRIPPFDYWLTVISQYANSPILTQLVANFSAYVDQTNNFEAFYDLIWNVDTAEGYGLDVWGRIVGIPRTLAVDVSTFFGSEQGAFQPFGQGPFYNGTLSTANVALSDAAYRQLIFAKALANISSGTIPAVNQILLNLFPHRGNCWVADNGDMSIGYNFAFPLSPVEQAIVNSGVLPKSTGCSYTVAYSLPVGVTWDAVAHGSLTTVSPDPLSAIVASNPTSSYQGARSNWFHSSGSYYFEQVVTQRDGGVIRIGVGASNAIAFTVSGTAGGYNLGDATTGTLGIGYELSTGSITLSGVSVGTLSAGTLGTVIGIAIDLISGLAWLRKDGGSWNGSATADPVLRLGGISISAIPDPIYAWVGIQGVGPNAVRANFGQGLWFNPPPTGFGNF